MRTSVKTVRAYAVAFQSGNFDLCAECVTLMSTPPGALTLRYAASRNGRRERLDYCDNCEGLAIEAETDAEPNKSAGVSFQLWSQMLDRHLTLYTGWHLSEWVVEILTETLSNPLDLYTDDLRPYEAYHHLCRQASEIGHGHTFRLGLVR